MKFQVDDEIEMEPFLVFAALTAIVLGLLSAMAYQQCTYWKVRGIPHLKPIPFLGNNISIFLRTESFAELGHRLYNNFPKARYYGMMDFAKPSLVVRDPELIKEITVKSFDNFTDHVGFVDDSLDPILGRNVFALKGDRWKEMRTTLSPSFTSSKMRAMYRLVSECAKGFVAYLAEHPEMAESLEAKDAFTRYTNDVIASAAFGIRVDSLRERRNDFYLHGKAAATFGSLGSMLKFLMFRLCPSVMRLAGVTFLSAKSDRFFRDLVAATVEERKRRNIVRPDMIHLLMQAQEKEGGARLTIEDIVAQALIFFLAGFDTSSTLMCFAVHELAVNPEIQERLYREIVENAADDADGANGANGANGDVSYEALLKMPYLDMVVSETLRKYPPAPILDRMCVKDFPLPGATPSHPDYLVKKGTALSIPVYGIHRDPAYYPQPDKFEPERFTEEAKANLDPYVYLPFGVGPRKCIANRFALMETKALLAYLLKSFVVEPTERTRHPVVFSRTSFNMGAKDGFWIKLQARKA